MRDNFFQLLSKNFSHFFSKLKANSSLRSVMAFKTVIKFASKNSMLNKMNVNLTIIVTEWLLIFIKNLYNNTLILSVCVCVYLTGYRLGPWRSYRYETGIIRTSMTWRGAFRGNFFRKVTSGGIMSKQLDGWKQVQNL